MGSAINNLWGIFNAAAYYFKSAVALVTSNIYFLGLTVILLLFTGKSLRVGKLFGMKG